MAVNIWFVMVGLGLLTFLTRLSFIALHNRWAPPELFRRALHFVPVAVLTAIVVPELIMHNGSLDLTPLNPRLIAGLVAIFVAWRWKNTVLTILSGMVTFWVVAYFFG